MNKAYLIAISIQKGTVISFHSVRNSTVSSFYQFPLPEPENAWVFFPFYAQSSLLSQLHLPGKIKWKQDKNSFNKTDIFHYILHIDLQIKSPALTFAVSFLLDMSVPRKERRKLNPELQIFY